MDVPQALFGFLLAGLIASSGASAQELHVDKTTVDLCKRVSVASSQFMDMRQHGATIETVSDGVNFEPAINLIRRAFSYPIEQTNPEKFMVSAGFGADVIVECLEDPSKFHK